MQATGGREEARARSKRWYHGKEGNIPNFPTYLETENFRMKIANRFTKQAFDLRLTVRLKNTKKKKEDYIRPPAESMQKKCFCLPTRKARSLFIL